MNKILNLLFIVLFTIISLPVNAQIKIKELPGNNVPEVAPLFYGATTTTKIIDLSSGWGAYLPDNPESKTEISIPAAFTGTDELILQREIDLSNFHFENYVIKLHIGKINYSANILLNDEIIYKHPFGEIPASFELNKELFLTNKKNYLKIHIKHKLDSESTIPVKQSYLMPESVAGIFSNVYVSITPKFFRLYDIKSSFEENSRRNRVEVETGFKINIPETFDAKLEKDNEYIVRSFLYNEAGEKVDSSRTRSLRLRPGETTEGNLDYRIYEPQKWTLEKPYFYSQQISFFRNDTLIEEVSKQFPLLNISAQNGKVSINDEKVKIYGVVYNQCSEEHFQRTKYDKLVKDLQIIKNAGFNTVLFSSSLPDPVAFDACLKTGLLAIINLPFNSIPEAITSDDDFYEKSSRYITQITSAYDSPVLIGFGLGNGYLPLSPKHKAFIEKNCSLIKNKTGKITFASFLDTPADSLAGLDFTGVELFSKSFENSETKFSRAFETLGKEKILIGPFTYPTFEGSTNGYKNLNSFEAQARNIETAINFVSENDAEGFILNSMFDYKLNAPSLAAGFNLEKNSNTGILGEDRNTNRLSYKIIKSKLNGGEKFNIPIGTESDDSPLFFILICIGLSILTALLINSKRKFREDASRALLRPYNFYADVRDQRILSGFHSNFLLILIVGSLALLLTNFVFYLKTNILLDKVVLSLGSERLAFLIGEFSKDPVYAFIYLSVITLLFLFSITTFIKIASLFVKNRVLLSSIYYTTTWSFLPVLLMLPVELALYKILSANQYNIYIYGFLGLFFLWLFQRLIKGIYVIFDIHPMRVYFYSVTFIVVSWGFVLLYFHLTETSVYYLINSIKQFALMH